MELTALARVGLTTLSAVSLVLAFPAFDVWLLAWIGLVPLFLAIYNVPPLKAFGYGVLWLAGFLMGTGSWIITIDGFHVGDFALVVLYCAIYYGMFGLLFALMNRTAVVPMPVNAGIAWVVIEYLRSTTTALALPLGLLGHSQYLNRPVIQVAALTGVYGISFLIVTWNAALAEFLMYGRQRLWPLTLTGLAITVCMLYGAVVIGSSRDEEVTITVIQGNVHHTKKRDVHWKRVNLDNHIRLTKQALAIGPHPDLVVWPEVAAQGSVRDDHMVRDAIQRLARESQSYLLIGSAERPKYGDRAVNDTRPDSFFNSAFLVSPNGDIVDQYNKNLLFPFGEYIPYKGLIPWPQRYLEASANFVPGTRQTVFPMGSVKFGVTICWENMHANYFRIFPQHGANVMINITNESLFGRTFAPYQFLALAVFRAVENRISVARSAYSGISAFVDPYGRILGRVTHNGEDIFIEGYLTAQVPISREKTFYTHFGDVFAIIMVLSCAAVVVWPFVRLRLSLVLPATDRIESHKEMRCKDSVN